MNGMNAQPAFWHGPRYRRFLTAAARSRTSCPVGAEALVVVWTPKSTAVGRARGGPVIRMSAGIRSSLPGRETSVSGVKPAVAAASHTTSQGEVMTPADVPAVRAGHEMCAQNVNSGVAMWAGKGASCNRFSEDSFQTCSEFVCGQERGKTGSQRPCSGVGSRY